MARQKILDAEAARYFEQGACARVSLCASSVKNEGWHKNGWVKHAAAVRQCAVKDRENSSDDDTQLDETEEEHRGVADCSGFIDDEWKGVRSNG